jgi:hypothetical protein
VRRRWAGDTWFAPVLQRGASHWIACLTATLPLESRVKGFETLFLNLLRVRAPDVRVTPAFGAQSGWLGRAYAGVLVASWVERADDAPAIQRDQAQALALLDGLGPLRRGTLPIEHQFDEEVVPGVAGDATDGIADPLKVPVRELVSRTVLRMTEAKPA